MRQGLIYFISYDFRSGLLQQLPGTVFLGMPDPGGKIGPDPGPSSQPT